MIEQEEIADLTVADLYAILNGYSTLFWSSSASSPYRVFSVHKSSIFLNIQLQQNVEAVEEMLEPKMYVLTQSGRSIVPVDVFYADGVGTDDFLIIASHRGDKRSF